VAGVVVVVVVAVAAAVAAAPRTGRARSSRPPLSTYEMMSYVHWNCAVLVSLPASFVLHFLFMSWVNAARARLRAGLDAAVAASRYLKEAR